MDELNIDNDNKGMCTVAAPIPDYRTDAVFVMVVVLTLVSGESGQIAVIIEPYQQLFFGRVL